MQTYICAKAAANSWLKNDLRQQALITLMHFNQKPDLNIF